MRKTACLFGLWLTVHGVAVSNEVPVVWPNVKASAEAEFPSYAENRMDLGKGVFISLKFQITTKGNGLLTLPGLAVRVYDSHDDGLIFRGGLLHCEWCDLDGDGVLELVVSGLAVRLNERTDSAERSSNVRGVFRYVGRERRFAASACSPEIYYVELPR